VGRRKGIPISRTAHLAIALGYSVVALVAMLAAAQAFGLATGLALGGFTFLLGALAHEMVARRRNDLLFLRRLAALRRISHDIQDQLDQARDEARRVYEVLEAAGSTKSDEPRRMNDVVAEVKVLQSLVERLSDNGRPAAADGAAAIGEALAPRLEAELGEARLLDIVRDGLNRDRVDLYLQPIVSLPQRKRRYFECFSRIRTEDGGIIGPEQYLEIAEQEGLVNAIDNMLLFRCVQLLRRTQKRKYNVGFFCNISRHSLGDTAFFHDFIEFMGDNADLAPNLFFEFAQADLAAHDALALDELDRLSDLGFRFSVDQVSHLDLNVTALASRHFGFVKVEAAMLLQSIRRQPPEVDLRDFKALLDQAGIDLIVEKIEGEAELVELLDYNIDYGQGFLFGEPRLAREL
jgi:cyclic-di-GMP phosphodiesterase TipF (flagellum assembly factor)